MENLAFAQVKTAYAFLRHLLIAFMNVQVHSNHLALGFQKNGYFHSVVVQSYTNQHMNTIFCQLI
ncbi:hypothetical protein D6R50_03655 [Aeromonas veronii]|uniref:Uncharacterized protein n=1 Tax=Aeromonas veronii TaxID=654 RepID=A0A3A9ITP5_AERVE|nr:hypothetical protein D6R50_03655 [Aeromonas veronii]